LQRSAWLARLGGSASIRHHAAEIETVLDALGTHVMRHCNVRAMMELAASARGRAA
jgi:adenosylcobyric acid synthase